MLSGCLKNTVQLKNYGKPIIRIQWKWEDSVSTEGEPKENIRISISEKESNESHVVFTVITRFS